MRGGLAKWLLAQHGPAWSFNYWAAGAPERAATTYPDDLDDTFCALGGLYLHDPKLIDAAALGKIVRLLLATESKVGGPYRTWLVGPEAAKHWRDVDVAVNANVAYFLRLAASPLPNLTHYMEQAVQRQRYASPYYPSAYPIMYYLARAYRGPAQPKLAAQILALKTPAGHWGSPLQTALMLSALHELGDTEPQPQAMSYILRAQQADGSWPAEPFWLEVRGTYSGSPELSTALILEALSAEVRAGVPAPASGADAHGDALCASIITQANQAAAALPLALRSLAVPTFRRMVAGDHNREIMLLAHFFAQSLRGPSAPSAGVLQHLGLANLYGWTAYTIYDDILDDGGDVRLLSLANTTLRWSLHEFQLAVPDAAFQGVVARTFTAIDAANAWEMLHCRFGVSGGDVSVGSLPHYGNLGKLAERSLGHALAPLGVLAARGTPPESPPAQLLLRALKHYLIARQLGDDMRDWEPDLRAGQCSFVVAMLLRQLGVQPGVHSLRTLIPAMQAEARRRTLHDVGQQVLQHIALAQANLQKSKLVVDGSPVGRLLDDLHSATNLTLREHAEAKVFLRAYNS